MLAQSEPYKNPRLPVEVRVQDLLRRMTVPEKIAQLRSDSNPSVYEPALKTTGFGFYPVYPLRGFDPQALAARMNELQRMAQMSRLGIPILPYEEALHGLIDKGHTSFPQSIALAATWDPDLVHRVAQAVAEEVKAEGIRQVLSPVINVDRDARWGRMEESYGEDPLLTSRIAVAFVSSFEKNDIVTTPKHFAVNLWDGGRDSNSVHISERQLFDTYLAPFEACFKEGGSRSVMCSYNAINGIPCASDPWLLTDILRKQFGFDGYVVSDWGAASNVLNAFHQVGTQEDAAAALLNAGMDCEDPGVEIFGKPLEMAVGKGLISGKTLDQSVARVLRVKFEIGLFENPLVDPATAAQVANSAPHRTLALEAARKAMVLLKNDRNTLPLPASARRIAVFGDLANGPVPLGGYSGNPGTQKSILEGLKGKKPGIEFDFVEGCALNPAGALPIVPANALQTPDGQPGLKGEYWTNADFQGSPRVTRIDPQVNFDWDGGPAPGVPHENFSVRWTGFITAPVTAEYSISGTSDDGIRIWIDGKLLFENWSDHPPTTIVGKVMLQKGQKVPVRVDYYQHSGGAVARLGWKMADDHDAIIGQVRQAANAADISLVFAGIREGEGQDRAYLGLPGNQEQVIAAAVSAGKPVVVVLVAGAPVTMEKWIDQVPAILDAWYPGEEGPQGIAEVLFGDANPGGKLPMTFPKTVGQCPLYYNFEPSGRGYDYVDSSGSPLFPFGHGLSYTTFAYSGLNISGSGPYSVSIDVTNSGARTGDEVVQFYLHQQVANPIRAIEELKGFQRVHLEPGQKKTVVFPLGFTELSMFDRNMRRVVQPGKFDIMVGSSAGDIRQKTTIGVRG